MFPLASGAMAYMVINMMAYVMVYVMTYLMAGLLQSLVGMQLSLSPLTTIVLSVRMLVRQ